MYQTKTAQLKLTWWPSPQDYNEAIQTPRANLQDAELCRSVVYSDVLGLPRPVTGSFACVYRMHCSEKDFALRLFLRNISDQAERYALVSDFVKHHNSPYTVTFHFLKSGIKIKGEWLPALKMEWVEGKQFDDYIVENLPDANKLGVLAESFLTMMNELQRAGIAHGDLQHGNIIMCGDELRLVDYDGMFVPAMHGFEANELGHRNYQHPERAARHFGPYLDNFSAWVIYASVRALQIDSRLMHQLGGGDDCLLFRQTDFVNPIHSAAFLALEHHESAEINALARFVRALIPALQIPVPVVTVELEPLSSTIEPVRGGPRLVRGTLPAWLRDDNATPALTLAPADDKSDDSGQDMAPHTVPPSWAVPIKPAGAAQWIKPTVASTTSGLQGFSAVGKVPPSGTIPPELLLPHPRVVAFNEASGKRSPAYWQKLMILSPFLWLMLYAGCMTIGPDNDLREHGFDYPATVTGVSHLNRHHTPVSLEFEVDGVTYETESDLKDDPGLYKVGDHCGTIHALPTNPALHEAPDEQPGAKQRFDAFLAGLCLVINLWLEAAIWIPVVRYRNLTRFGIAVLARVDTLGLDWGSRGKAYNVAVVSFLLPGNTYPMTREVRIAKSEAQELVEGTTEVMLCNPNNLGAPVFYKFCRYHPVPQSAPAVPLQSGP